MNDALLNEWKSQSKKAGKSPIRGASYAEEYEYHLGMFSNPLPFQAWKLKYDSLERLQAIPEDSPRYLSDETFKREKELCNALGY